MIRRHCPAKPSVRALTLLALGLGLGLGGCATTNEAVEPPPPPVMQTLPPSFPPQDLVGSYGLAAYHKPEDRERTEAAAVNQCKQPYVITMGGAGGVMMHLADQPTPTELRVKGAPGAKNFIGPADDPPGSPQDREVMSFDGRILILRWLDPEVQGRYGTMVYVRCPPEGVKKPKPAAKPKVAARPAPKPVAAPRPVQPPIQRQ